MVIGCRWLRQSQLPTPCRTELNEENLGDPGEMQRLIGQRASRQANQ